MFASVVELTWATALALTCAWAFWRGGKPEYIGASILIAGTLASQIAQRRLAIEPQYGVLTVDVLVFLAFVALLLRSRRWWPVAMSAFMLLEIASHVSYWIFRAVSSWAYLASMSVWSYMLLVSLAVGVLEAPRRTRSAGRDASVKNGR